jgi:GNAT superfamily N-acetyltransferase
MSDLPAAPFLNPVWHALHGPHRHLAIDRGEACRYPADVSPFAAVGQASLPAFEALRELLVPREPVWIVHELPPRLPGLVLEGSLECLQMVLPTEVALPAATSPAEALTGEHAAEMVALTDAAFPGFFRRNTYRMGSYFGLRRDGALAAMAGERLTLDGHPEMSSICTHPNHRGQGLARTLIIHLAHHHRRQGLVSWLQVGAANTPAIALYRDLGFKTVRSVMLHRLVGDG